MVKMVEKTFEWMEKNNIHTAVENGLERNILPLRGEKHLEVALEGSRLDTGLFKENLKNGNMGSKFSFKGKRDLC